MMKLSDERKKWLRERLEKCDYVHIGPWGDAKNTETFDIEHDVNSLLDEVAELEASNKQLRADMKVADECLEEYLTKKCLDITILAEAQAFLRGYATHSDGKDALGYKRL